MQINEKKYRGRKKRKGRQKSQVITTRYGLTSFRSEAPRIRNSLPNNMRAAETYPVKIGHSKDYIVFLVGIYVIDKH